MKHLQQLGEHLVAWGLAEPRVRAILWYGSMARGDAGVHSDLDAAIVIEQGSEPEEVVRSCTMWFGHRLQAHTHVASRAEVCLWLDNSMTKADLYLARSVDELAWLADSPDIVPPRLATALDKDRRCGAMVARAAQDISRNLLPLVNEEVEKFLVAFEACSAAHRRSDAYQFYFQYNLALHRLARLVELARGTPVYLFLPKLLLPRRMSLPEQLRWRELRGTLYLPEANQAKRRLADSFLATFGEISVRLGCRRKPADLAGFLNAVIDRDLFFNVRDFADAYSGAVRPGRLFRTSTLTRWQAEPLLKRWLAQRNVQTIVDFRHPAELTEESARYSTDLLAGIRYVSLPLSGAPQPSTVNSPWDAGRAYEQLFFEYSGNVVKALKTVAEDTEGSTVVHCHAGKDRTGWFCAALALLLDLPEDQVVHDYVLSGQGVEASAIQHFIESVARAGGVSEVLTQAGLSEDDRRQLRASLLTGESEQTLG